MEAKRYRIEVNTNATLVYYVVEYDIQNAIELAMDAPYKEWHVSEFKTPPYEEIIAEETRL
jgi:hypothetical protein